MSKNQGPAIDRFLSCVDKNGPIYIHWKLGDIGRCWVWKKKGPRIMVEGRKLPAHRYSWIYHNGNISKGLLVCHHCDHGERNEFYCVNPAHLFLGTPLDNWIDRYQKGRVHYKFLPNRTFDPLPWGVPRGGYN